MGFYSFYKIIKDIISSILGNKAWRYTLIIALIVLFVVLFTDKANAVESQDYVVDYYTTYSFSPDPSSTWYYNMTIIPVFANSSYSISWPSGYNVSFSFVDNITRENSSVLYPYSAYENGNDQGSYGYFAIKDGYLIAQYRQQNSPYQPFNFTITTDYDFTSNLQTIHQDLSTIIDYLYGNSTPGNGSLTRVPLSVHSATTSNTFYITSGDDNIFYVPLESNRINSINFHVDVSQFPNSIVMIGYCDSIPSDGVAYTYIRHFTGSSSYDLDYNYSGHKYVFVRAYGRNTTCTISSFNVSNVGLEGMNDNATYQGEATRDTLTDSNISQNSSDYSLPSDSTNDITQDGFGSIFDRIRATFTSGSSAPITITIPFTNRSFTISKQTVFGSANLGIVGTIIQSFWWFVVSLFIVKDIFKKIESIKSGNIEFAETTNIKEDIL